MVTVMGATGHTGKRIAQALLDAGRRVRAIGRSAGKLAELKSAGAEVMAGDQGDAAFLAGAFRGAEGVFTLIPPDVQSQNYRAQQDAQGEAIAQAVRESEVPYVVCLSSVGGHVASGTGPVAGLHAQEERLRRLPDIHLLVLRPAYFFENFYDTLGLIKHQGINGGGIGPDVRMPMIATRDVAEAAAAALERRDWNGVVVRELLGERDLTHAEATRILGARIGKPDLQYVQFPYEDFAASLVQMGVSANVANLYAELFRAVNDGLLNPLEGRSKANTTPTSFEEFAGELASAYERV